MNQVLFLSYVLKVKVVSQAQWNMEKVIPLPIFMLYLPGNWIKFEISDHDAQNFV